MFENSLLWNWDPYLFTVAVRDNTILETSAAGIKTAKIAIQSHNNNKSSDPSCQTHPKRGKNSKCRSKSPMPKNK